MPSMTFKYYDESMNEKKLFFNAGGSCSCYKQSL